MSDIALTFNNNTQEGDLCFRDGDIALDNPLKTAILVSLFSNRLAPDQLSAQDQAVGVQIPGNALNSADEPRQGWWGDMFEEGHIGSRLWQLKRVIRANSQTVLLEVEAVIHEALEWLSDDGIVSALSVTARWSSTTRQAIDFSIVAAQPTGSTPQHFEFSLAWDGLR